MAFTAGLLNGSDAQLAYKTAPDGMVDLHLNKSASLDTGAISQNVGASAEDVVESSEPGSHEFHMIMGVWLPGAICLIGIFGNFLALLVLMRDHSQCPSFYSLRALATSDIILLICAMLQQVIPLYCFRRQLTNDFCLNQGYIRVYTWPVICMAQLMSIWMTLLISTERYVAICHPLQAARMRTIPRVQCAMCSIVALAVIFNIPKFFEFRPLPEENVKLNVTYIVVGGTYLRENTIYRYLYNTALYCLVMYIIPIPSLAFLNYRIVSTMNRAKKQWEQLNRTQQRELKATILPLCIVCVYFVCSTQSLLAFILDAVYIQAPDWLNIYTAVVNLLVIINSAVNFILMYLFGRKFRNLLFKMLSCQPRKGSNSPILKERSA